MTRPKPAVEPIPRKFQVGTPENPTRVQPTAEAAKYGWNLKTGVVVSCGHYTVSVLEDGDTTPHNWSLDYWILEDQNKD